MSSKRIKPIKVSTFKGINRDVSSNDASPEVARILRDMRITPEGKLVRRPEYDTLYDYRPQQFEHTTDDDANQRRVAQMAAGGETYLSHRRKCIALGASGATEYVFTGYVQIDNAPASPTYQTQRLYIERGTRSGLDITWMESTERLFVFGLSADAQYLSDIVDFSMVMDSTKTILYIVISYYDASAATRGIVIYSVTNLYTGNFATATLTADVNNPFSTTAAPVQDIDVDFKNLNLWIVYVGSNILQIIRYRPGVSISYYSYNPGVAPYAVSIVNNSNSATDLIITYSYTSGADVIATYATLNATSATFTDGLQIGNISTLPASYQAGPCCAIDTDGTPHWLYLNTSNTLTHSYLTGGAISSQVMTAALSSGLTGQRYTGWDFVVKNGCVTIFYCPSSPSHSIYKAVRIVTIVDTEAGVYNQSDYTQTYKHDLVEKLASGYQRYFNCYRKYETNTSNRLTYSTGLYFHHATDQHVVKYLHSDKGLYNLSDVHTTDTKQQTMKAIWKGTIPTTSGTTEKQFMLQCDDNRLYRRINYMWMLLEGQRTIDNSRWNWNTVYTPRSHPFNYGGVVRFPAGTGATNQTGWYSYIDRYYFNNDEANRWTDHFSQLARPAPPTAEHFVGIWHKTEQDHADPVNDTRWIPFAVHGPGIEDSTSRVISKFRTYAAGGANEGYVPYIEVFGAISFEYDNTVESQLLLQASNSPVEIGIPEPNSDTFHCWKWIAFGKDVPGGSDLALVKWDSLTAGHLNQRITAINLYLGEMQSEGDTKETVQYYKVKRIQVSAIPRTGESVFDTDTYEGTAVWTDTGSGIYSPADRTLGYVDFSMWDNRAAQGTAAENLGNPLTLYKSTGSGTELYTKQTFIPEGYAYAVTLQNEVWVGGVRLAGVSRANRLMRSARRLGTQVTPDQLAGPDSGAIADLPYDIQGLAHIDDSNLVVIGSSGIHHYDITGGVPIPRKELPEIGTNAADSVLSFIEGGVGQGVRGALFKDIRGNIRIYDGYGAQIISHPIRDDYDASNLGVISLNSTSMISIYVPLHQCLFLIYGTQLFVYDFISSAQWLDWRFAHSITAVCAGVDGELYFSDGKQVFIWPQAGTVDSPNPIWRGSDIILDPRNRGIAKAVFADYLCPGTTLKSQIYRDGSSANDATNAMAASASKTKGASGFTPANGQFEREIALGFGVTSAANCTDLQVDRVIQEILILNTVL